MKKVPVIIGIVSVVAAVGLFFGFSSNGKKPDGPINDEDPTFQNQLIEVPKSGKPSDYDVKSNIYMANYLYAKNSLNYSSFVNGKVTAKVTFVDYVQNIVNNKTVNNDEVFLQALSVSSMKSVGVQRYITPSDFIVRKGSKVTMEGATWDDKAVALTKEAYLEKYGGLPFNFTSYILNDYSILDQKLISSENDNYVFEYTLDPELAPARYSYEIMTMGGASGLPSFKESVLTVTMDNSWRVLKINQYEKYSIPLFGGITCTANLEETFSYSEQEIDVPERDFFSKYFGSDPTGDITEEKTAVEYLGEAFMPLISSDSPLYIDGILNTSETSSHDIKAKIILNNEEFEFLVDNKIYAYLIGDDAVLKYGNIAMGLSKNELMSDLQEYLPENEDGTPVDLSSLISLDSMGELLEDAVLTKEDNLATISLTIEDMLEVDLLLRLDDEDCASLQAINGRFIKDNNYSFSIHVSNDSLITFPEKPNEISYITNLESIKEDVISISTQKAIETDFSLTIPLNDDSLDLFGTLSFDFNDINNIIADGEITVVYGLKNYDVHFSFIKDTFFVSYKDNINLKLSLEDSENLISYIDNKYNLGINEKLNTFDLDSVLSRLSSIDIETLLSGLRSDENGFSFLLNLAQLDINETISLGYTLEEGFVLESDFGKVTIRATSPLSIIEDTTRTYIVYDQIISYIDAIDYLMNQSKFDINIDLTYAVNGEYLSVIGSALIDLNNGLDFALEGKISYGDIIKDVEFTLKKIEDFYYLHFADTNIKLSQEELITFVSNLDDKYSLGLNAQLQLLEELFKTSNVSDIPFDTLLDSIILGENISLSLNTNDFGIEYGVIDFKLDVSSKSFSISSSDFEIEVYSSTSLEEITIDSNIVFDTIRSLEHMQTTIERLLEQKYYRGQIISDVISGELYADISDIKNPYLHFEGEVTINDENDAIILSYQDHKISLAMSNLGISLSDQELIDIIKLLDEEFSLKLEEQYDGLTQELSNSQNLNAIIEDLILGLRITDNSINFSITYKDIGEIVGVISTDELISLNITNENFSLEINSCNKLEKELPDVYYANADETKSLIRKAKIIYEQRLYSVSLNIDTLINNSPLIITGQLSIDLSNGLDLHGDLDITFDKVRAQIEIAKIQDKLYIHSDSLNFAFSYEELRSFIIEINRRYKLGIDVDKIPETLTIPTFEKDQINSLKILSLLKTISFSESGLNINIDSSMLGLDLGNMKVNIAYDNLSSLVNISGDIGDISVDYGTPITFSPLQDQSEYLSYNDAIKICNLLDTLIEQFKIEKIINEDGTTSYVEKSMHFTFNADIFNSKISQSGPRFKSSANVFLKLLDTGDLNIKLNLEVSGESNHTIDLTYINNTIYCTYNGVNMAIEWKTLIQTLRYANDSFKFLDDATAQMIFDLLGDTEKLDSTIFDDLIKPNDSEPMLITNILKSLTITNDTFAIVLNNDVVYSHPTSYDTTGMITLSSGKLSSININHIYSSEYESFSPTIVFDDLTTDIVVPTGEYNFFNNVDTLLKEFVKTAELRNYHLKGNVIFNVFKIITGAEINDLEIKIQLDENSKVYGYIHLTIPQKAGILNGNTLNIYIEDDTIYIDDNYNSNSTIFSKKVQSYQKYLVSEFLNENAAENIINLMHFTSIIHNQIISAINSPKDTTPSFEKTFKEYRSDAVGSYYLRIDGGDLASDSNVGEISMTLNSNSDGYLYLINDLQAGFLGSLISIVVNLELTNIGQIVEVPSPNYSSYA